MTKHKETKTSDAIAKLEAKDGPAEGTQAYTNELLAARDGGGDTDPVKASLELNDPSKSHAATNPEGDKK